MNRRELVLKAFNNEPIDKILCGFWHHYLDDEAVDGLHNPGYIVSNLEGARKAWEEGYIIYNSKGEPVYPETDSAAEEPTPFTLPNLQKGDNNDYVESLQCLLIGKGISCGTAGIDHIFGAKTEEAVRGFQARVKLKETGICDTKTWEELLKY